MAATLLFSLLRCVNSQTAICIHDLVFENIYFLKKNSYNSNNKKQKAIICHLKAEEQGLWYRKTMYQCSADLGIFHIEEKRLVDQMSSKVMEK